MKGEYMFYKKLKSIISQKAGKLAALMLIASLAAGNCVPEETNADEETASYSVGGSVSGLNGTVVLTNNGGDDLTITADGSFTFASSVADGGAYNVQVKTQPSGQTCTPGSNTGTISGANVTDVAITCSTNSYSVGGSVSGLSGTLVLQNNGGDDLTITADGSFTFASSVADGGAYNVQVNTHPAGQTCSPGSNTGTISGANVTNVSVACYNSGSLDTSFGTGGKVTTAIGAGHEEVYAIAIQSDGKIVAAGISDNGTNYDFALARYNSNGSLDTTFGTDGKVTTAIGTDYDEAYAIAIQADGKIVAAGYSHNGSDADFALARYNSDGSLDTGFGTGGKVTTAIGAGSDGAYAIAIQSDGKIVAAGYSHNGSNEDFALARYNTDGSLDTDFGTGGKVTTAIGSSYDYALAIAIQVDGKIVAAGYSDIGSNNADFALARYNTDGSLDTSFDTDGKVTTAIGSGHDEAYAIAIQSDGKIVVAGDSSNGSDNDFALARYNTNGSLDTSFDTDGQVTTAIGSSTDIAKAIAIQSDGKIVAAGRSDNGDSGFALARYNTVMGVTSNKKIFL
jgi:uncharacterized delta-60 repeat protein